MYLLVGGASSSGKSLIFETLHRQLKLSKLKNNLFPGSLPTRNFGLLDSNDVFFYRFKRKYDCYKIIENENEIPDGFELNDFKNEKIILTVRDPRVIWFIDDHYDQITKNPNTVFNEFLKEINNINKTLDKAGCFENILIVKYEDLIYDIESQANKILDFLEIKENRKFDISTKPANKYISSLDYFEKYIFTAFYKHILNKDDLDIISNDNIMKKFINSMNYSSYLYEEDITERLDTEIWNKRKATIDNLRR